MVSVFILGICPRRCLQPIIQAYYSEEPFVPLFALVAAGHGFETPVRNTTVMFPSEPSCHLPSSACFRSLNLKPINFFGLQKE